MAKETYKERKAREALQRAEQDSRRRYYIMFQWRSDVENERYHRSDFRRYRQFAVWPKLFKTKQEAWDLIHAMPDIFVNLRHKRKITCSVQYKMLPKQEEMSKPTTPA